MFNEDEYKVFEDIALRTHSFKLAADEIGISYQRARYIGYTKKFRKLHPDHEMGNTYHFKHTENYVREDKDLNIHGHLARKVNNSKTRSQKLAIIANFREQLIRQYGQTLMDVPDDEPGLIELQAANRALIE